MLEPPGSRTIAVVIAAMNAERTIGRAIATALAAPEVGEVVVVDDASSDGTARAASAADDGSGRLVVHRLTRNGGPAAARNHAIARSSAPLVGLLDADDYLQPGRFARLLQRAPEGWDMVADDILIVPDTLGDASVETVADRAKDAQLWLDLATFVRANISRPDRPRGELGFVKPLLKRAFLERHGLRYDERLRLGEDYALYVSALASGARFALVGACGYVAVERANSLSGRHSADDLQRIVDFDARCLAGLTKLSDDERNALRLHQAATHRKAIHARVLETRRRLGFTSALAELFLHPRAWRHVVTETARAKLRRAVRREAGTPGVRLLLDGQSVATPAASNPAGTP
ncbi:MAG: glycosyltransferase family 2 protein [Hyphomicrobiaceae bacterium]